MKKIFFYCFFYSLDILPSFENPIDQYFYLRILENPQVKTWQVQLQALENLLAYYKDEVRYNRQQDIQKSNFNRRVISVLIRGKDFAISDTQQERIESLKHSIVCACGQIDPQIKEQKIPKKSTPWRHNFPITSIVKANATEKNYFAEIALENNFGLASVMIQEGFLTRIPQSKKGVNKVADIDVQKSFQVLKRKFNQIDIEDHSPNKKMNISDFPKKHSLEEQQSGSNKKQKRSSLNPSQYNGKKIFLR